MFGLHVPELVAVTLIALLVLGPKRLPEAARGLGQAIRGFRQETQPLRDGVASVRDEVISAGASVRDEATAVTQAVHAPAPGSRGAV